MRVRGELRWYRGYSALCKIAGGFFVMKTFPQKGATIRPVQGQAVYTIGNMDSGGARQGIRLPTQRFQTF